ncbi:polyketide cyclase [Mycolicibacterium sp. 018/SC-01/001]|uniref:SRPBCC family protein n=1 Tax=Mycolicibacterium sp. 018/SC-01/001 TaxID=2592069 RepID=UPI0011808587|nr:SRPBCC family protein [Mycolicibacterium sp. 018/SC-01/001]TRW87817.1 polyketide cyclase [Mycolicibacterium sp. 018/SC-01/001]
MPTVSRTFTVNPPPTVVVDYLKDFAHAEQWDPGTQRCERIDSGPVAEGAYWHNVSKILGVTAELTYTLDELTDHKVVFVGENGSSTSVDTITVEPEGPGSIITYEAELHMHGTARLLNPVMKLAFEKMAGETEKQLVAVLNGLAQAGGASR